MVYEEHPNLTSPEDENEKVWRYMDFPKFMSILDREELFFNRADKFDDKFEGSYSKFNIESRLKVYKGNEFIAKMIPKTAKDTRKFCFINCWHLNRYESAAMWNTYAKNEVSIAIQSTFKRLKESFNKSTKKIYIGKVNYADYETDWIPEDNIFNPYTYKRKSFEHEKELRAIYFEFPPESEGKIDFSQDALYERLYVDVDITNLIETVYLSPLTDEWFSDLIKSVIRKYNHDFEIRKSDLCSSPVY
jgi:hypothetical protein